MKTMKIVSNKIISKNVFIDDKKIDPLDFGTIVKLERENKNGIESKVIFERSDVRTSILNKYNLSYEEYDHVCKGLEEKLGSYLF